MVPQQLWKKRRLYKLQLQSQDEMALQQLQSQDGCKTAREKIMAPQQLQVQSQDGFTTAVEEKMAPQQLQSKDGFTTAAKSR